MWTIDPQMPMSLWWALMLLTIASLIWYVIRLNWNLELGRRTLLITLLALGIVGPLLIALNPTWVETIPPVPGKPMLTVLVDGTMSMTTEDIDDSQFRTRWRKACELASQIEGDGTNVEVRKLAFGNLTKPFDPERALEDSARTAASVNSDRSDSVEGRADDVDQWPQGHRSDLAQSIRQSIRTGSPLGHALVMISDGAHNVGSTESVLQAAREANALATPIHTITLGTSLGMKNMSVAAKAPRMLAFPDSPVTIRAVVAQSGLSGSATQVQLLRNDKVLQSQTVRLSDPAHEVRFVLDAKQHEGILDRFRIVASEVEGEVTAADNETSVLVQRLSAPIEVLVLEGKPYWDSKFLLRNLANDPVVNLTTIVRLGPSRFLLRKGEQTKLGGPDSTNHGKSDRDNAESNSESNSNVSSNSTTNPDANTNFDSGGDKGSDKSSEIKDSSENSEANVVSNSKSTRRDDWEIQEKLNSPLESAQLLDKFRLVILGRDANAFLTPEAVENLRSWISSSGGCLLCSRGSPADQLAATLAEILPVRWSHATEERVHPEVTQHALDTSIFDPLLNDGIDPIGTLPTLAIGASPKTRTALPQTLMQSASSTGSSIPIVTYQPFGTGQTVVVEGAGMWRWAFLPPEHAAKDKIYPTMWQSMVQWIISQQDMLPGQEISIRSDRATFLAGDRASASVSIKHPGKWDVDDLSVLLQSASFDLPKRLTLTPLGADNSLYRVDLGALDVGYYSLKVVRGDNDEVLAAGAMEVRDPWFESLEVDARPDIMRHISRLSSGDVLDQSEVSGLVERFAEEVRSQQKHEETRTTMWDRPWVLLLVIGTWMASWIVRRRSGIV